MEEIVADILAIVDNAQIDESQKRKTILMWLTALGDKRAEAAREQWDIARAKQFPWKTPPQARELIASIRNEHGVEAMAAWCRELLPKSDAEDDAHNDGYEQGIADAQTMIDETRAEMNTPAVADVLNVIVQLLEKMKP